MLVYMYICLISIYIYVYVCNKARNRVYELPSQKIYTSKLNYPSEVCNTLCSFFFYHFECDDKLIEIQFEI